MYTYNVLMTDANSDLYPFLSPLSPTRTQDSVVLHLVLIVETDLIETLTTIGTTTEIHTVTRIVRETEESTMMVLLAGTLVGVATGGGTLGDMEVETTTISMVAVGMNTIGGMIGVRTMMITVVVVVESTRSIVGEAGVHHRAETTIAGISESNVHVV